MIENRGADEAQGESMGRKARRAAGTQTFTDLLLHPRRIAAQITGAAGPRAEADLEALNAGEAREVSAFTRSARACSSRCAISH